jgi:adenosylmethionine-8-amino-7-oxononanoate aminotransferase
MAGRLPTIRSPLRPAWLGELLKDRLADHPHVADVRGIGFLWGVELVKDKKTNAPFERSDRIAEKVWEATYKRGVIVYKATGLAGTHGDAFLVAPPFVIETREIELAADTIRQALDEVLG